MLQTEGAERADPKEASRLQVQTHQGAAGAWRAPRGQVLRQGCRRVSPAHHPPPRWTPFPTALGQVCSETSVCSKSTDKLCSFVRLLSN